MSDHGKTKIASQIPKKPDPQVQPIRSQADQSPVVSTAKNGEWHTMDDAPKDGQFIYLKGDEIGSEWYWYITRQFRKGVWQPVGWWRRRFGPSVPPSFKPEGWRSIKEGLP